MNNKGGFSLVELAIGLAVVTILILGISVSAGIRDNARLQSAANSIYSIRSAAENYLSNGNLSYANLTFAALKTANLLPSSFSATSSNPWGGNFTLGPNGSDNSHFDIALTSINASQATKLTSYFNNNANSSYDSANNTWTATF